MNVELITIGDELLSVSRLTPTAHFRPKLRSAASRSCGARRLANQRAIVAACGKRWSARGAVITTAALGPTTDDLSVESVAKVFGREMQLDDAHLE